MIAIWLPGGVTHLQHKHDVPTLCGRDLDGTLADCEDGHKFPQHEGQRRTERYCKLCAQRAREDGEG